MDEDDVGLIFEDIHRGRSIVPPYDVPTRPALVRWDAKQPLALDNCVVLEHKDAEKHADAIKNGSGPEELWGKEVIDVVKRRQDEVRKLRDWVM